MGLNRSLLSSLQVGLEFERVALNFFMLRVRCSSWLVSAAGQEWTLKPAVFSADK